MWLTRFGSPVTSSLTIYRSGLYSCLFLLIASSFSYYPLLVLDQIKGTECFSFHIPVQSGCIFHFCPDFILGWDPGPFQYKIYPESILCLCLNSHRKDDMHTLQGTIVFMSQDSILGDWQKTRCTFPLVYT